MCILGWNDQGFPVYGYHTQSPFDFAMPVPAAGLPFCYGYEFNGDLVPFGSDWKLLPIQEVCKRRGWYLEKGVFNPTLEKKLKECKEEKRELQKKRDQTRTKLRKSKKLLDEVYVSLGIPVGDSDALIKALNSL